MRVNKKAMLAAGLIAGAAAMTGCTASTTPAATPTPQAAQQETAAPATAEPTTAAPAADATMEPAAEETTAPIGLLVDGKEVSVGAAMEQGKLLRPLSQTAEALGWDADSQQTAGENQTQRVVTLERDGSRITVSWTVSDNTAKGITWQKDGLLIPVDARLTTLGDVVYVPAAFFEEAMDVSVSRTQQGVSVRPPQPKQTAPTKEQTGGENG